jgi:hypothetical protein
MLGQRIGHIQKDRLTARKHDGHRRQTGRFRYRLRPLWLDHRLRRRRLCGNNHYRILDGVDVRSQ